MTRLQSGTKSDRTRQAILDAARVLFSRKGFKQTTVRDVAARADVDPALINRYFGGKDGLFAQATDIRLGIPDLSAADADQVGAVMIRHFLSIWEDPEQGVALTIMLRTAASDTTVAARLREIFAAQVRPAIERVAPKSEVGTRSGLVATQVLGLALARYVLKLPPIVEMSPEVLEASIGPTLQRYATGEMDV